MAVELCHTHKIEHYSVIKKDTHKTWMNLERMLKAVCYVIPFILHSGKSEAVGTEGRLMDSIGQVWEGEDSLS